MPNWDIKDAPRIIAAFVAHWTDVNQALGRRAITLRGGYGLAELKVDQAALATHDTAILDAENADQLSMGRRTAGRTALRERLRQFRKELVGDFSDTEFVSALPTIPSMTASDPVWDKALGDMASVWKKLNATTTIPDFVPPLALQGNYAVAQFDTDRAALSNSGQSAKTNAQHATDARRGRDSHLKKVRARLIRYRQLAVSRLPEDHPLLVSLPNLDG